MSALAPPVMAGLVLAIHVLLAKSKTWMPGIKPGMTGCMPRAIIDDMRLEPNELPDVIKVEYLGGFRLRIRFSNGSEGERDFTDMVSEPNPGPILQPLVDPAYFARVFVDMGALTWPNGFDYCPDYLHKQMRDAGELAKAPHRS